jgi:hypothetical protein
MEVYLGKDKTPVTIDMTTHTTVKRLTKKLGHGHLLYTDNFFSSPDLSDETENQLFWKSTK